MKTNKFLVAALAGITLAGCSSDDELQYPDFTGPVEVQFAGELTSDPVLQTAWTRSGEEGSDGQGDDAEPESGGGSNSGSESANDDWAAPYLSIGITPTSITGKTSSGNTIGKYFNVKYTTTSTGTTATFKAASDTIYFQSPKETVTFAAYSPYYEDLASGGDNKGIITLSADNAHNVTDYIWAQAEGATYTDNKVNFTFTHIQSKLKINVKLDESVSLPKEVTTTSYEDDDMNGQTQVSTTTTEPTVTIASVKIEGLVESGTFNTATGVSTTASGADATEILYNYDANTGVSVAEGYEYIIIPQTIAAKGFILTVTTSNGDIYKKTFDSKITFDPGYAYTYNITAKKYNLEVEATISKWSEEDEEDEDAMMTEKTIAQFEVFSDPDETQIYDLAFSDGTFMRIADADGNIPTSLTIPDDKTVSGIVYYIGDVTADDPTLKREHPDCTHGLIVALDNAAVYEERVYWQNPNCFDDVYANFQNAEESLYSEKNGYKKIQVSVNFNSDSNEFIYGTEDFGLFNLKLGFNNTFVLRKYNEVKTDNQVNPVLKVDAYAKTNTAPEGSSGWYLPSPMEMALWCENVNELSLKSESIKTNTVMEKLDKVFSLLSKASITCVDLNNVVTDGSYWTSLEGSKDYAFTFDVYYYRYNSYAYLSHSRKEDSSFFSVRAVCAF